MTIEEATKLLKMSDQAIWLKGLEKERKEAEEMAIKSLEAWELLREELKYELCKKVHEKDSYIPCPNQTTSCSYVGLSIYELNNIIDCVIDKHLSEVSK